MTHNTTTHANLTVILLTSLAPIIWGTTYILTTEFLPENIPFITAMIRTLPLGVVITLFYRSKLSNQLGHHTKLKMLILAFLNISLFQAMLFVGAYRLPGGIVAMIGSIQPLVLISLLYFYENQKPKINSLIAIGFVIFGMALLMLKQEANFKWDIVGITASMIGSVAMAVGIYLTKKWQGEGITTTNKPMNMVAFTGWQLLLGGLLLLPVALVLEDIPTQLTISNIFGFSYLAIFGSAIAYSLWMNGVVKLPTVTVSILGALSPITATLIGWICLEQSLNATQSLGFFITLVAVGYIQLQT